MVANNIKQDVEQYAEADALAVMLFADVWFVVEQKGMPAGAGILAPRSTFKSFLYF